MRFHEIIDITEAKRVPQIVPWPTNMAWRIKLTRYAKLDYFRDFRKNKAFAIPFRNWERTFYKLTLKDSEKIKYMPTEVIEVPPDSMVADMDHIDTAMRFIIKNDPTGSMRRGAEPFLDKYEQTMVPYSEFVRTPDMFRKPEIMVERAEMKILPYRVVTSWDDIAKETVLAIVPK